MKHLFILAATASIMMTGCAKSDTTKKAGELTEIGFDGSVDIIPTRATSALPLGTTAYIGAYATAADVNNSTTTLFNATSSGKFTAHIYDVNKVELTKDAGQGGIFLPINATYDFYTVSPSTLTFSIAGNPAVNSSPVLANNVDYLWAKTTKAITAADKNVVFTYTHSGSRLVFELEKGDGVTVINSVNNTGKITATNASNSTMRLDNGVITPGTAVVAVGAAVVMDSVVNVAAPAEAHRVLFPMLPLITYAGDITVTFDVVINNEKEADNTTDKVRTMSSVITLPTAAQNVNPATAGFHAGKSYKYKVVVAGSGITFKDPMVTDWEDVDLTGTPITPQE